MLNELKKMFRKILKKYSILSIEPHLLLVRSQIHIVYRCAIALQLGAKTSDSAMIWAERFFQSYLADRTVAFDLKIQPDGSIDCFPRPWKMATFLDDFGNNWQEIAFKSDQPIDFKNYPSFNPFYCQYAHARCCSLRRLAIQEKVIEDNTKIPWLASPDVLNLSHIREWGLLRQLIYTFDRIEVASPKELIKLTKALSQEFLLFDADCRIFGEVAQNTPHIAQVRLGLIGITELILKDLLTKGLNLEAPTEL